MRAISRVNPASVLISQPLPMLVSHERGADLFGVRIRYTAMDSHGLDRLLDSEEGKNSWRVETVDHGQLNVWVEDVYKIDNTHRLLCGTPDGIFFNCNKDQVRLFRYCRMLVDLSEQTGVADLFV